MIPHNIFFVSDDTWMLLPSEEAHNTGLRFQLNLSRNAEHISFVMDSGLPLLHENHRNYIARRKSGQTTWFLHLKDTLMIRVSLLCFSLEALKLEIIHDFAC